VLTLLDDKASGPAPRSADAQTISLSIEDVTRSERAGLPPHLPE